MTSTGRTSSIDKSSGDRVEEDDDEELSMSWREEKGGWNEQEGEQEHSMGE
jgi:hypothetical protein